MTNIVKSSSKENCFNIERHQDMLGKLFPWMRDWENAEIGIVRSGMTRMCPSFRHVHRIQISEREKEREREVQRGRKELSRGSCSLLIQLESAIANTCYHGYSEFNQALDSRRILWLLFPFVHDWHDAAGLLWDTLVKIGHRLSAMSLQYSNHSFKRNTI